MKKYIYIFNFLILWLVSCKPLAYKNYLEGEKQAENLNYSVGIEKYLESWNKLPMPETARGLAQAYFKTRNFDQAEEWYRRLERDHELHHLDLLPYAETLIANSKYSEASTVLKRIDSSRNSPELELIWKTALGGKEFLNKSSASAIFPLENINSPFAEFGPYISEDSVLHFTSDRFLSNNSKVNPTNALKSEVYGWTGNSFLKMYKVNWSKSENKNKDFPTLMDFLQSQLHVGPLYTIGDKMFLTLTQEQKFKKSNGDSSKDYTLFPGLYFALKTDSMTIDSFKPLPFNAPFSYTVTDPFYDTESKRLYFSSDMPGGYGEADLYYSQWENDSWSAPVNLGTPINTKGAERTPYISKNGIFYFSSSGHAGLGGLDIFKSQMDNGKFLEPENLGSPINSNRDDFGLSLVPNSDTQGVFASDRQGGAGSDDLYYADLLVKRELVIKGHVIDKETNEKLKDAVVTLLNDGSQRLNTYVSDENGAYRFSITFDQLISLETNKTGYLMGNMGSIAIPSAAVFEDSVIVKDIYINKIVVGKTYKLENIYYDFDKWEIRDDAKPELDKLIKILSDNPTIKIELYSHTDSRGSNSYNLKLSDKRAKAVIAYLKKAGINESRLKGIGKGEEELLNSFGNNHIWTEEQHQENRRTEFKITEY